MPRLVSQCLQGSLALAMLVLSAMSGLRVVVEKSTDVADQQSTCVADGWRGATPTFADQLVIPAELPVLQTVTLADGRSAPAAGESQVALAAPTDRLGSSRGPRAP